MIRESTAWFLWKIRLFDRTNWNSFEAGILFISSIPPHPVSGAAKPSISLVRSSSEPVLAAASPDA